ncbi:MAG TPA: hypothetical protein VMX16_16480 [Terriglobia bacterium]|nr:hypothetical protein [Terriglobia bacterium]
MKKLVIVMVLIGAVGLCTGSNATRPGADEKAAPDFRKAAWGMTVDEVKATETGKPDQESDIQGEHLLDYDREVGGFSHTTVFYIFAQNKLARAKYIFNEEHSDDADYISDFQSVEKLLEERYGPPSSHNKIWKSDDDQDEFSGHEGLAVATGALSFYTEWDTSASAIIEALDGDNYSVDFQVEYDSVLLKAMDEAAVKKAKANQF